MIPRYHLSTCKLKTKPYPSPRDLCVFWCPDVNGMPIPSAIHNMSLPYSLHGWFPHIFTSAKLPLNYTEFLTEFNPLHIFIDSTTLKPIIGCGQYREYLKHGAKSGYSYHQWAVAVDSCSVPIYPHQCRFNGTHNIVQTLSTYPLSTIGCASAPYVSYCVFHY